MSGAGVQVNLAADPRLLARLERLAEFDLTPLLDGIGMEVETQTRNRIQEQEGAPDGSPWPAWSPEYHKTRQSGQQMLDSAGHLRDSLGYLVEDDGVVIWPGARPTAGSPMVYAATHQFGDPARNIPQREFLGLTGEGYEAVVALVEDYLEGIAND